MNAHPRSALAAALLLAALALPACTTMEDTGRRQLILISPQEEARHGYLAFQEIKRTTPISRNRAHHDRVRRIGKRIVKAAGLDPAGWEFVVFEDDEPNAFALPGGKIGVNTGILRLAKTDGVLATVIAHEVAHVKARHGAERASQGMLASLAGSALSAGLALGTDLPPGVQQAILSAYGLGATVGVILPYSRTMELEADKLGLFYMARAGYDPRDAMRFWLAILEDGKAKKSRGLVPAFLSTHPLDDTRIKQLDELMPAALQEWKKSRSSRRS